MATYGQVRIWKSIQKNDKWMKEEEKEEKFGKSGVSGTWEEEKRVLGSPIEKRKGGYQGNGHFCGLLGEHTVRYCRKKDQYMIEQWRLLSPNGASNMEEEDWNHPHAGQRGKVHQGDQEDEQKSLASLESSRRETWREVGHVELGAVSVRNRLEAFAGRRGR